MQWEFHYISSSSAPSFLLPIVTVLFSFGNGTSYPMRPSHVNNYVIAASARNNSWLSDDQISCKAASEVATHEVILTRV